MDKLEYTRPTRWLVAAAVAITLVAVLVAVNFVSGEKKIQHRVTRLYSMDDPRFRYELGLLLGPPFLDGNRFQVLRNGDELFPSMLAAIKSAQSSITFETYSYWSGDTGREFARQLALAARRGVKVHLLLDWLGSAKMDQALLDDMIAAGVQVCKFHPPHWSHLARMNNRTQRKRLVVDGTVAFTGGVGIAQQWTGHAQDPEHWRDTHFRVDRPVVAQMQSVSLDNWTKVTGEVLHGVRYFPALTPLGHGLAQMFGSSPSGGSESMTDRHLRRRFAPVPADQLRRMAGPADGREAGQTAGVTAGLTTVMFAVAGRFVLHGGCAMATSQHVK